MPSATPSGPLLTIESRGGRCVGGACGSTYFVESDGRVHVSAKPPNDVGAVDPDLIAALIEAIDAADFDEIRSHPFTGTCPTDVDGTELVLEFATAHGIERIEGCQVAIDWSAPPFSVITAALAPWISS